MKSNLESAMKGDLSKLTNMINNPEIQNMVKMINPQALFGKLENVKLTDSTQFSDKGSKLFGDAINNENDSDAIEAKSRMGSSMKKIKLPWFIRKLIKLSGEDLGDLA
jgi:H2-forming N5,N10-methylenetetrahydromethanopterin dehydrogenase-like enzyme